MPESIADVDRRTPTSRTFISQRLRLHYVEWGDPDAPPLVLLHGGRDHCRSWDWVARRLSDRWRVIAPDLRGHGDSQWSNNGLYVIAGYIYDFAQLIHQLKLAPVTVIAHSLGGNVALRYTGLYPDHVRRIVAVEGLGFGPDSKRGQMTAVERMHEWIDRLRDHAARSPRRYPTLDEAIARMREANAHLNEEQVRHLTIHGIDQNEDGSFSWKFDPYVRQWAPYDMTYDEIASLWSRITCPVLLMGGTESWHPDPRKDGRARYFKNAEAVMFEGAGHWVHHDRLDDFMAHVVPFIEARD
ncbi:MAG: alpha/beta fold hydrolase [Hyphomicrobiaceae bacterium]